MVSFFGLPVSELPLVATLAFGGVPLVVVLLIKAVRREFGSDLLAGMSIVTSVVLHEYLAGSLVVLMLSGGEALEAYAVRSASSVLEALAKRMPSIAHRKRDGNVADVALGEIAIGDTLVVFPHDICPVDGTVVEGHGVMDESYLTGEPYLMSKTPGSDVLSGAINGDTALTIRAEKLPVDSRYAKIMQVMRASEQRRPRLRRLGDQLGAYYTPVAVAIALARLGRQRRRGPIPGRAGGGHALPAAHRHPGRHHRLGLAGGPTRHHHQGSGRAGKDRHLPHRHLRQDRHAHLRPAEADRGARGRWFRGQGGAGAGGQPGALLEAPAVRCHPGRRPRGRRGPPRSG